MIFKLVCVFNTIIATDVCDEQTFKWYLVQMQFVLIVGIMGMYECFRTSVDTWHSWVLPLG
jgi:hypothetical protein